MPDVPQLTPALQGVVQTPLVHVCPEAQHVLPHTWAFGQHAPLTNVCPGGQLVGQAAMHVPAPPLRQVPVTQK
jgi:hypothetical protein